VLFKARGKSSFDFGGRESSSEKKLREEVLSRDSYMVLATQKEMS
jgi:hypothetical protein